MFLRVHKSNLELCSGPRSLFLGDLQEDSSFPHAVEYLDGLCADCVVFAST